MTKAPSLDLGPDGDIRRTTDTSRSLPDLPASECPSLGVAVRFARNVSAGGAGAPQVPVPVSRCGAERQGGAPAGG